MTYKELIDFFKTERNAARELEITQPCINHWKKTGRIPRWSQHAIADIVDRKLKADKKEK